MLAATAAFAVGDAIMKFQSGTMPLGQSIFLRGILMCVLVTALLYLGGSIPRRQDVQSPVLLWRTLCDSATTFFYIAALARVPLADAGAIIQINPLIVMAGAALFIGERIDWQRWTAVAVGFAGVLLIIQPGLTGFSWASLLVIGAALTSAARDIITRRLPGIAPLVVAGAATFVTTLLSLGLTPFETWSSPSFPDFMRLAVAATSMILGSVLVVVSINSGDVSAVVPFRYSSILWALLLGLVVWGHIPNSLTLTGIVVVMGAGLYVFLRKQ